MLEVTNVQLDGPVLRLVCSGTHGIGSDGNESATRVTQTIRSALGTGGKVSSELELDYRAVAYEWGDGPVSSIVPFVDRFRAIRIISSPQNSQALRNLVQAAGLAEWITVTA